MIGAMVVICRKLFPATAVALAVVLATAFANSSARAREVVSPPSPADFAAALEAAGTPAAISFAKTNFRQVHGIEPSTVAVADHGVAAYVLNPDFVRGVPGAPAGVLQYIAVTATADNGVRATLRASPEGPAGEWVVGSVFSGDDEETLSRRLRPGSVLLNEPQINGWYELTAAGVVLLQASLPQSPEGKLVPLAEYQQQVRSRYGDKLPGSAHEKDNGIGPTQQHPAPPPPGTGLPAPAIGLAVAGAVGVLAVAALLFRRSRYSQRKSTPASEGSSPSK
ncbi:hypothetical protein ACQPZF_23725 [Actinosynnema sp. CS-041913]|uniref:hypothetical protein n=1 Tax=Actinosynnema sp. CS-041913 TaxID=3239917 RepID=UPI003D913DBC